MLALGALSANGCALVNTDTAQASDPTALWRNIECAATTRHQFVASGGDTHPTATGVAQGNSSYRKLTVLDGDDFYGERCELGRNNWRDTFQLYREGEHLVTFVSYRLPSNFPLDTKDWQTIFQMKQTQPAANAGNGPVLEMGAQGGKFVVSNSWTTVWSTPVVKAVWLRVAFDVVYSQDAAKGRLKVYVDANGDGDASDSGEQSPTMSLRTLIPETAGSTNYGIDPGQSIPGHLRLGLYHNPVIACPAPLGCSVDVDNVQVIRP